MRRINLSKSTGKIADPKIDSVTQLTVSGDILTADNDDDDDDWLTNFLSTETASSPGHIGNIRKVKAAAHAKGTNNRPATAPAGEVRPRKSIQDSSEVIRVDVLVPSPSPENSVLINNTDSSIAAFFPSDTALVEDVAVVHISDHSSKGSVSQSQVATTSAPKRKKTMTASFSAKADQEFQVITQGEDFSTDLTIVGEVGTLPWPANAANQRRKSGKPQQVEKISLVSIKRFVRLVDYNLGSDLKPCKENDSHSCDGNESTESTEVGNAVECSISTEITCWLNREIEPTFILSIVGFEEKEKSKYPKTPTAAVAAARDMSSHSKRKILLETEAEISFTDLCNPGLVRLSRNNTHETNIIKELLEHVSRKETGALQSGDLEMLQRFAHDISSAVELVVHKDEQLADARVVLNVAADFNIVSEFSSHHVAGMRFDHTLLSEKTYILLRSAVQIPLVIHGTSNAPSFSFPVSGDEVGAAADGAAAAVVAAAVSSLEDYREVEPHAIFPHEKLFCLVRIYTIADDQVLVKVHTVQQSSTCKSRGASNCNKKRPILESDVTLSQHFTIPTIIVSALAERNSRDFTSGIGLDGILDDEHREMISAFTHNVLNNLEIEHVWQSGRNSLVIEIIQQSYIMVLYGQIVIGPPGSGKTTFCSGMKLFIDAMSAADANVSRNNSRKERACILVNLDFANDQLGKLVELNSTEEDGNGVSTYSPDIDVRDLITIESAMESMNLGPNGGLVYCMEYLLNHFDWLEEKISSKIASIALEKENNDSSAALLSYIIFDCPGQVELYTHHSCVQDLILLLSNRFDARLCSPAVFVSAVLLTTTVMLKLALPHVSILSKIDLVNSYGPLPFNLDFFTEMMNLAPILRYLEGSIPTNDQEDDLDHLTAALCEVVDDFGLVSFLPLNIQDKETMARVLMAIDDANGFSLASFALNRQQSSSSSSSSTSNGGVNDLFRIAARRAKESTYSISMDIQERYMS
eukprot:gene27988-36860_t